MNQLSLLIHSGLMVSALLPLVPMPDVTSAPSEQLRLIEPLQLPLNTESASDANPAYGRGIPQFRSGGATR